jgi:hypothetical protein
MSGPRDQEEMPGYDFNAERIRMLKDRIEVLEAELDISDGLLEHAKTRIEQLEAALRQFVAVCDTAPPTSLITEIGIACAAARAALAPEQDK